MLFCDIASFYSPTGGGVAAYHNQKLSFFAGEKEHRYMMIAPSSGSRVERLPGGRIFWVKGLRYDRNYYHLHDYPALKRIMESEKPDAVEFGSPYLDYWIGRRAVRRLDALKTAFYHADFPDTYVGPFFEKRFGPARGAALALSRGYLRLVYNRLDGTFVASKTIAAKLQKLGVRRLKYLPLGVDARVFSPAKRDGAWRESLGLKNSEKVLLFAGRYRPEKGIDRLIRAAPEILRAHSIHIAFAGTGPFEEQIRRLAAAHKNVHDLGFIPGKNELARAYASADGFLSPGGHETFGLGMLEALASGLPVLAAGSGIGGEIVSRFGCGLLVDPSDPSDIAEKARLLLSSDFSGPVKEAGGYIRENFGWDRTFRAYIAYNEELKRR